MTEPEGEAIQSVMVDLEQTLGIKEEVSHNCCFCGRETYNEPDQYGDIYCSVECWSKDTERPLSCPDCGLPLSRCDCLLEIFE